MLLLGQGCVKVKVKAGKTLPAPGQDGRALGRGAGAQEPRTLPSHRILVALWEDR